MTTRDALTELESQLNERINTTATRRNRDKVKATLLRISSVLLAGVVTVLIGLQGENFDRNLLRNLALILGASITVVNAFDAFFDHKALWIKRTVTLVRLYGLQRDLRFEIAKVAPNEISIQILESLNDRLDNILEDDLREWIGLRAETEKSGKALKSAVRQKGDSGEVRSSKK
jgi:hypothetical protein